MILVGVLIGLALGSAQGATLEKLSLDDMIQKSTEIVRGTVTGSSTLKRGPVVYTSYHVQVRERWKGSVGPEIEVNVPGGRHGSLAQTFSGSPKLEEGGEYLLFLWTSRSGLTQVIGLCQGLFRMNKDSQGEPVVSRSATGEVMLDSSGKVVEDAPVSMRFGDMVTRIQRTLAGARR